jgi:DNA-binding MarR family transcriptional regulator/GNAT superfamily N-acetyltransferase
MTGSTDGRVGAVREFNRFWTRQIGALGASLLQSPYSLTEARVLFELAQRESKEVAELRHELDLDAGYLSRMLARFKAAKLVVTGASSEDGRRQVVRLTAKGRHVFADLDGRSAADVSSLLDTLGEDEQQKLVGAMTTIRRVLGHAPPPRGHVVLRAPAPGDFGWIVQRHGALYAGEYHWDEQFEALVARIVADYVAQRDPRKDCAWIAELDGEPVGCVFCVRKTDDVAQLRLLLVVPRARGSGVGTRLVEECIRFAERAGYRHMVLWTNHPLHGARRIYERAGFRLVAEEKHRSFGHDLVGQNFELDLAAAGGPE